MATAVMDTAETFAADGAPLEDEGLDEEETFASSGSSSATQDPFDAVLSELEVLMMDEQFNSKVDEWTAQHCEAFQAGDENKLEYTHLFGEYTALVEQYIERQLGASLATFDMASFCATLSEKAKADETLLDHPALEMLSAYSDFAAFKELMLSAKAGLSVEAAGGAMCVSGEMLGLTGAGVGLPEYADGDDDDGTGEVRDDLVIGGLSIGGTK